MASPFLRFVLIQAPHLVCARVSAVARRIGGVDVTKVMGSVEELGEQHFRQCIGDLASTHVHQ